MKNLACLFLVLAIAGGAGASYLLAQVPASKPAEPDKAAKEPPAPAILDANKIKLLEIQHEIDAAAGKLKDVQLSSNQLFQQFMASPQAKDLQSQADALIKVQRNAEAELRAAKSEALKAAGLDETKFELDMATLMPIAKPAVAKPAAPPVTPPIPPAVPPR